jgi:hypothetical protein
MKTRVSFKKVVRWAGLPLAFVTGLILLGLAWPGLTPILPAQAANDPLSGLPAPNAQSAGPFGCTISNIAIFQNRIHVHCTTAPSGTSITYFAAKGDAANALATNRFLVMMNTAYTLGKPLYIYYYTDTAENPPGCNSGDCRGIYWLFVVP